MNTVEGYMGLAEECMRAATILYEHGSYRNACGRAYYAYFDAIRALLTTKEITTKSHAAARALFGEHFVRTGLFTTDDARALHKLFLLRQGGEYEPNDDIDVDDVQFALKVTSEFLLHVESYLRVNGYVQ